MQFVKLKRAPDKTEATLKKAPHKPLLLFAVMDMVERGEITSPFISLSGELTELNALFSAYWRVLMPVNRTSSIAYPFSRMNSEPFWKLVPVPGLTITKASIESVKSVPQLRTLAIGAEIDAPLYQYMRQDADREQLRQVLLMSHFSDLGRCLLSSEHGIQHQSYEYARGLERAAHGVQEMRSGKDYSEEARSQGFRRAIVTSYDHRCALCGVRIVTAEGHTVVEAAHIQPWSAFKDDDIRNGMALCPLCHWSFDEGLMSVDDDYQVLTSRQMTQAQNAAGFLMTLTARPIFRPHDQAIWPDRARLVWHRQNVFVEN